jgi:hypothetical protein
MTTDNRASMKLPASVKAELKAIQKELKVKTEGHALAYLEAMYRMAKKREISLDDHQRLLKAAEEANNQASL